MTKFWNPKKFWTVARLGGETSMPQVGSLASSLHEIEETGESQ
jgi:hypothetical protein